MARPKRVFSVIQEDLTAPRSRWVKSYMWLAAVAWTAAVFASLTLALSMKRAETYEMARVQARAGYEKDVLYRRWNAIQGGVYAPLTDSTPANPYLDIPEREITTPSGKTLTMQNPAYMTRQAHELGAEQTGIQGHITSLNPIRPENAADYWETGALQEFEQGIEEVSSVEMLDGVPHMRLMRPLVTEEACLQCHAAQGYQVGDIRGGISASVPMSPLWAVARPQMIMLGVGHVLLWVLGLGGIVLGMRHIRHREQMQEYQSEIYTLRGILPICSYCKKVREDSGYWRAVEGYVAKRSEADFSHGICPKCEAEHFGNLD